LPVCNKTKYFRMISTEDYEKKLNNLFDLPPIATITLDREGYFSEANESALELFGYELIEIKKIKIHDLIHPDEKKGFLRQFEKLLSNLNGIIEIHNSYITKSGDIVNANLKATLDNDSNNIFVQFINLTDQINAGIALKESEERYRLLVENSPFCIHSIDNNRQISSMNPAGLKMLGGISEDEVCGIHYLDFVGEKDKERVENLMKEAFEGKTSFFDFDVDVEGKTVYFKSNFVPIIPPYGKVKKLMGVTQDVTELKKAEEERIRAEVTEETNIQLYKEIEERKRVEEELKKSIKEKKVLLKEIHHRVKNNLQLVSSLLKLQAYSIDNQEFSDAIYASQNRIKSMALVHENLYQSKTLSEINIENYLNTLLRNKLSEIIDQKNNIYYNINTPNINFEIEQMLPIGLIINEFVTNSIKYALNEGHQCLINIELSNHGKNKFTLSYKDNGPGLIQEFKTNNLQGLGLELVDSFVSQLGGTMKTESTDKGLGYSISFQTP